MKNRNTIFVAILSALACFAVLQATQAVEPAAPDLSLPGGNTADGQLALLSLTSGTFNSAFGFESLLVLSDASFDTGIGAGALLLDTAGTNTAVGAGALLTNSTGSDNNAFGTFALFNNIGGSFNNAHGRNALLNSTGSENNAFGDDAMFFNTSGGGNSAFGDDALDECVDGSENVAVGDEAGTSIVHGSDNVAVGAGAQVGDGSNNVAVGSGAGVGLASASRNIAINVPEAGPFADFDDTCFIGSIFGEVVSDPGSQAAVFVDQFNVVGIFNSSRKYKHDIQPMDKTSEELYRLKPVTFKFNSDWKGTTQYGLIAEEVAEVDSQLVVRKDGELVTVRYEQVNAMLLNEFLKEHKKVQDLETTVAQQQKGMEVLTAQLKEQAAQIQKVSARLEVNKPAPQVVANKP